MGKNEKSFRRFLTGLKRFCEEDSYILSVAVALIVAFILLICSYPIFIKSNEFVSFYILDEQKTAKNYPELLVIGENNTCKLWVVIENHMKKNITCKVLLKITKQPIHSIPLQVGANASYIAMLNVGEKWEEPIEITFNDTGCFNLVFELWIYNEEMGNYAFSNNFCVLSLEVMKY